MNRKILIVDDDLQILKTFQRNLGETYSIEFSASPGKALELVQEKGPFAVVVSDLRMPEMNGVEFLVRVRELQPDAIRIMLTGDADVDASIKGVNEGRIFRFLTKPCAMEMMVQTLEAALEQYRLVIAERELLRETLHGSIRVLSEVLSMANPEAFGRCERIKRLIQHAAKQMKLAGDWRIGLSAMLSQIGCVSLPTPLVKKVYEGKKLTEEEQKLYASHPVIGAGILSKIPRLEEVAAIIAHQEDRFDSAPKIPLGSRLLRIALDYDTLELRGVSKLDALTALKERTGLYDPDVLATFEKALCLEEGYVQRNLSLEQLQESMILNENIRNVTGALIMIKGQEITTVSLARLNNFVANKQVTEPFKVLVPLRSK
jgi:response regulator RpfG family c-di-GMP phosphodiesterase